MQRTKYSNTSRGIDWNHFSRVENFHLIAEGLNIIPDDWRLTPNKSKNPYRDNWQKETSLSKEKIASLLIEGDTAISKSNNRKYHFYTSGFGLITGLGLLAIDIDGSSALPLLLAIANGALPNTVSWTSGKHGRSQLLYKITNPNHIGKLKDFRRKVIKSFGKLNCDKGEILEFRYNDCQSVLPPSYHPDTGSYKWINPPDLTDVAIAPESIIDFLIEQISRKECRTFQKRPKVNKNTTNPLSQDLISYLDLATERLGTDIYSWEGHNFMQVGNHLEGCCPNHESVSGRSFHVNLDNHEWYCHGCNEGGGAAQYRQFLKNAKTKVSGKEFYNIVKDLCDESGITIKRPLPNFCTLETNPESYKENVSMPYSQVRQNINDFISKKRENWQYKRDLKGSIIYDSGDRLKTWKASPYRFLLDRSLPGLGKSHDSGKLTNDEGKVWLISAGHRNPTTITVENNFVDYPTRNLGLKLDRDRTTPSGNFETRNVKRSELPDIPSNCLYSSYFYKSYEKGYQDNQGDKANPICGKCKFFKWRDKLGNSICSVSSGVGHGYKLQKESALNSPRIRAHLDSIPSTEEYDYSNDIAIVDEAELQIRTTKKLVVSLDDFEKISFHLVQRDIQVLTQIAPIINPIIELMKRIVESEDINDPYGITHDSILKGVTTRSNHDIKIPYIASLLPRISDYIVEPNRIASESSNFHGAVKAANRSFAAQAQSQTLENFAKLPTNFLIPLLEVILGNIKGALRINPKGLLEIITYDSSHIDKLKSFKKVIFLDATANNDYLETIFNEKIQIVEESSSPFHNLEVVHVNTPGVGSNKISDTAIARIELVTQNIKVQYPELEEIKHKKYAENCGYWFKDSRGTNRYSGKSAIAAVGLPRPNFGAKQDEYLATFGTLSGFEHYYNLLIQKEIFQLIGRQRSHLYPDQRFRVYLICSNFDLEFLKQSQIKFSVVDSFSLNPEAGTTQQYRRFQLVNAIANLLANGKTVTQSLVANLIGVKQPLVSKIAASFDGGWQKLILFLDLLIIPNRDWNISKCPEIWSWITGKTIEELKSIESEVDKHLVLILIDFSLKRLRSKASTNLGFIGQVGSFQKIPIRPP